MKDRVEFIEETFDILENEIIVKVKAKDNEGNGISPSLPSLEVRVEKLEEKFKINLPLQDRTLEDRVEFIETLLQEYYLDTDFLKLLKRLKDVER